MSFRHLLDDATRLTRSGDLTAATAAIRRALDGGPPKNDAPPPPAVDRAAGTVHGAGTDGTGTIIDGEYRRVTDTVTDPARPSADTPHGRGPDGKGPDGERARTARADTTGTGAARPASTGNTEGRGGQVLRARHDGRAGSLDYRLFVPRLDADAPPPPLLVMLHGCTQNAEDFATGTGMDALARTHGLLVLYPEQSGQANPQRCWNWFKHTHQRRGRGEPGLIEEMVRAIVTRHGADPRRVFVAGLSAGGAMAAILGDTCPTLFAAVGVHSGLAAGAARDLPGAMAAMRGASVAPGEAAGATPAGRLPPTIVFHGDADRTVHPQNGEHVFTACVDAATAGQITTTGAESSQSGTTAGRRWTRRVQRDGDGRTVAEHWLVHGAGHAWSGGDRRGSYTDAAGPDASGEMVRFFLSSGAR